MAEQLQDVAALSGKAVVDSDEIDHPSHYTRGEMEVIDAIEGMDMGFHEGNIVKYVARYKRKGGVSDLKKARWYLDRLICLISEKRAER